VSAVIVSAVGLETGSGQTGLFSHWAGPVFFCSVLGRAGPNHFRAGPNHFRAGPGWVGLDIFGPCRALEPYTLKYED